MELRTLIDKLSIQDKKVLLALKQLDGVAWVSDIEKRSGLEHVAVMRAALNLTKDVLVQMSESRQSLVMLTEEGKLYAKEGLPERRMLVALAKHGSGQPSELALQAGLSQVQVQISLGWLKQKGWAEFAKREGVSILTLTENGEKALSEMSLDERLLARLAQGESISVENLEKDFAVALRTLKERKLVEIEESVRWQLALTELGERALSLGIELVEDVSELTHDLLVSGRWREVKFRRYDATAPGAPVFPGKVHPQQQVIDELREILLEMGFVEIKNRLVESEFWNFDALFQAQDHPAREIHDSLSLAKPSRTSLPPYALVKRVATAHERGVAGSTGWRYKFNIDVSRRPVMCSQTTAATVRYLASHPEPPLKVFCFGRVYRHEKIDYKHLAEFYQCEGIVMDRDLTMCDMFGYLKQILIKLGFSKVRFRPGYFPYTEPSVECDIYFPEKREWLEVLGAGMFRPELLHPLGIKYQVLAWGIGFSRLAMLKLKEDDIRVLFKNDIISLRERRMV